MKHNPFAIPAIAVLLAITVAFFLTVLSAQPARSQVLSQVSVATTSTIAVGPQAVTTIFSRSQGCANRVVSTVNQPIMLSFNTGVTPSGVAGHIQAASSTVVYPASQFGCGAVTAYGYTASSTITKAESR